MWVSILDFIEKEQKLSLTIINTGMHPSSLTPLYTGGFFHCYMLKESICHFRGIGSILSLSFYF